MVRRLAYLFAVLMFSVSCGSTRLYRSEQCGVEFRYPRGWVVDAREYEPGRCSMDVNPKEWKDARASTEYEVNTDQAVTISVDFGTLEDALQEERCLERRGDSWRDTCGRAPSYVESYSTTLLTGVHWETTYGAFFQGGEGGYQGLASGTNYLLGNGTRYVSMSIGWCTEACEGLVDSVRLRAYSKPHQKEK